jgi:hypothetical protein
MEVDHDTYTKAQVIDKCSPELKDLWPGMVVLVPCLEPNAHISTANEKKSRVTVMEVRTDEVDVQFNDLRKTVPLSDVDFGWKCTRTLFEDAKKHGKKHFPGKLVTSDKQNRLPIFKGDPNSCYVTDFLTRKDVAQQHLESNWKPSNKNIKWRLLQTPYKLYFRLREEMVHLKLKPVSWTYFYKIVCTSGSYEVLKADNCCCATCRDLGFYNFNDFRSLVKDIMDVKAVTANILFERQSEDPDCDVDKLRKDIANFDKETEKVKYALLERIDKQVFRSNIFLLFSYFINIT